MRDMANNIEMYRLQHLQPWWERVRVAANRWQASQRSGPFLEWSCNGSAGDGQKLSPADIRGRLEDLPSGCRKQAVVL